MRYVTHKLGPYGRMGHQAKEMFSAVIFSKLFNLKFVYHPFLILESKGDWESFLNLGKGEIQYNSILKKIGVSQAEINDFRTSDGWEKISSSDEPTQRIADDLNTTTDRLKESKIVAFTSPTNFIPEVFPFFE